MIVQIVRPVLTIELACKIRDSMRKLGDKIHVPTPKGTAEYVIASIK